MGKKELLAFSKDMVKHIEGYGFKVRYDTSNMSASPLIMFGLHGCNIEIIKNSVVLRRNFIEYTNKVFNKRREIHTLWEENIEKYDLFLIELFSDFLIENNVTEIYVAWNESTLSSTNSQYETNKYVYGDGKWRLRAKKITFK